MRNTEIELKMCNEQHCPGWREWLLKILLLSPFAATTYYPSDPDAVEGVHTTRYSRKLKSATRDDDNSVVIPDGAGVDILLSRHYGVTTTLSIDVYRGRGERHRPGTRVCIDGKKFADLDDFCPEVSIPTIGIVTRNSKE